LIFAIITGTSNYVWGIAGFWADSGDHVAYINNNVIYGFFNTNDYSTPAIVSNSSWNMYCSNNTVSARTCFNALDGVMICKNNIAINSGNDVAFYNCSESSEYNATNDTIVPGTNNRVSQTFTFVDADNGDYRLSSNDDGAKGYGTDLSDDTNPVTVDKIGYTRPSTDIDIGAFQTQVEVRRKKQQKKIISNTLGL
jgi:hypothetical protein